jgi:hypothetical protein
MDLGDLTTREVQQTNTREVSHNHEVDGGSLYIIGALVAVGGVIVAYQLGRRAIRAAGDFFLPITDQIYQTIYRKITGN